MMRIAVILPAAGTSTRFNGGAAGPSKIEAQIAGKAVFLRSLERFTGRSDVGQVLLAVNPDRIDEFTFRWGDKLRFLGVDIVQGGTVERWHTVAKALEHVRDDCTHVAVHDAARPMASEQLIDRVFAAGERMAAVIPGLPVASTLKRVVDVEQDTDGHDPLDAILGSADKPVEKVKRVAQTVDRSDLVEVQTPQLFEVGLLRKAYQQLADGTLDGQGITDDASLVEAMGEPVYVVEGESLNIKLTRPEDAELAAAVLEKRDASEAARKGVRELFGDEDDA